MNADASIPQPPVVNVAEVPETVQVGEAQWGCALTDCMHGGGPRPKMLDMRPAGSP